MACETDSRQWVRIRRDALSSRDSHDFVDDRRGECHPLRRGAELIHGASSDRTDAVEGCIEGDFFPNGLPYRMIFGAAKPRVGECRRDFR